MDKESGKARTPVMPWGYHAGTPVNELDASYLLWLYENDKLDSWDAYEIKAYIDENIADLEDRRRAERKLRHKDEKKRKHYY